MALERECGVCLLDLRLLEASCTAQRGILYTNFESRQFESLPFPSGTTITISRMSHLVSLFSQYEMLHITARYLSTIDLFHIALACSDLYTLIRKPDEKFRRLTQLTLCDGSGLQARQNFEGIYSGVPRYKVDPLYDHGPRRHGEEEIEVRVWTLRCDETGGLPCQKCGVNVCEECRFVPRVQEPTSYWTARFPWICLNNARQPCGMIYYCDECDAAVEARLNGAFCNCDQYKRWVCLRCYHKEEAEQSWYLSTCMIPGAVRNNLVRNNETMLDEYGNRACYCPCGRRPKATGNMRCIWCKRKHEIQVVSRRDGTLHSESLYFERVGGLNVLISPWDLSLWERYPAFGASPLDHYNSRDHLYDPFT